ncbi:DNA-directed RNA polymerase specialized sigma subunit, sigma24 family [Actinacidiphila rubida]|uniref:DNA-directed RNA polymerase specialized sigma subunit, sigma24 family n=1 Tax=Actinacidiphila rubida TaxID=310780 RepID=A0A1H8SHJ6_9ACTN|nr:sigma-70 family RNA polymerase sigma factor [Actinacidiphila rubida]SEO77738.1 DNA-directed RNA polymerase specialized sigma subunit, sigma24 family [Actinacidiphila rubida]
MSRQETPTQSTGAHRRHRAPAGRARATERDRERRPQGTLPMQPPGHYEPYLDGLFTYCLSILCEHDAATAALGETLALAERQRARLHDPGLRRPWLYALARWACLRRLAAGVPPLPRASESVAEQRRAQLASLAWPEAAGTTPEQREALELAVRHQLTPGEIGHVLGLDPDAARSRLARAACEVERTRTALAVVDTGRCALVAQLAGETRVLLGTALRTELVRHVDECAVCRRTAERVVAQGPWPGAAAPGGSAVLALVEAPRAAAYAALLHAMDTGAGRTREGTPGFDRRGFPLDLKDRAARRAQLRHRAVTTTVVAAVVAAPVLALWAAYRAAPLGDEAPGNRGRSTVSEPEGLDGVPYEKAGSSVPSPRAGRPGPAASPSADASADPASPAVSVSTGATAAPTDGSGYLLVAARPAPGRTLVTLTASGGAPVKWSASTSAYWLELSARGGVLQPGESVTLSVRVDRSMEPSGHWSAVISFDPGGAQVRLHGSSSRSVPPPSSSPPPSSEPPSSSPPPSSPPPSSDPPPSSPPASSSPPQSTAPAGTASDTP